MFIFLFFHNQVSADGDFKVETGRFCIILNLDTGGGTTGGSHHWWDNFKCFEGNSGSSQRIWTTFKESGVTLIVMQTICNQDYVADFCVPMF